MAESWWSIEILDHEQTADQWRESYGAGLVEAAITHGAQDWNWHRTSWGLVFEVAFDDDERWVAFRALPLVTAALDAAPDPINGVMVYPGRGGHSGSRVPRRTGPITGGGAAPIPSEPPPITPAPAPVEVAVVSSLVA